MNKNGKISPIVIVGRCLFGLIILIGMIGNVSADPSGFLSGLIKNPLSWIAIALIILFLISRKFNLRSDKTFGTAFIILGILGLGWTGLQFLNTYSFQKSEVRTIGTIVSVDTKLTGGRFKTLLSIPTITFDTDNGKSITFVSDIKYNPGTVQANQKIPVAYDKNNPGVAHVDEPYNMTLWIYVGLDLLTSILFLFFGWFVFIVTKRKAAQNKVAQNT